MAKKGVLWTRADKSSGSRKQGWEEMRERFRNSKPKAGAEGYRDSPGIFIFRECTDFIALIPSLPRDDKDLDDVDTESEDHIGDEARYRVRKPKRTVSSQNF